MTAILAIDFMYQIITIADCRVSWKRASFSPQDNLQKIYPIGPTGILGFSGSILAAKAIVNKLVDNVSDKPLPPSAADIVTDIASSAREAYSKLSKSQRDDLELMYVAPDFGKITLIASNVTFVKNLMVKMEPPRFLPIPQADAVRLGYANKYPMKYIKHNRDNLLNMGLSPEGRRAQVGIVIGTFAPALIRYAPHQVGGLFPVGVATTRGVDWYPYGPIEGYELVIENGQYVQIDHNENRKVPLKRILDFDPYRPDAGNLIFQMRSV